MTQVIRLVKQVPETIIATAIDNEVEAAMANLDAEYAALVAESALVSA